ncbi:MAG: P-II family nitrogen regulator [Methanoregula sp.]|nr:P-II family nitrogen regulator [Methanoregula sp.]
MKMIWAIIQYESTQMVIDALEKAGIHAMTRMDVTGYDVASGIPEGSIGYTDMPKSMLMIVLADNEVARAVKVIRNMVKASMKNHLVAVNHEKSRIFVTYVEDSYTIRTAETFADPESI